MQDTQNDSHQQGYNSNHMGMCNHCGGYHRFFAMRLVLGIIILGITFWLGLKVGEFKGAFENGGYFPQQTFRSHRMQPMMYPAQGNMMYQSSGMMLPSAGAAPTTVIPTQK